MENIPMWAQKRAGEVFRDADPRGALDGGGSFPASWIVNTLARYIAEHEEPPVDPLLVEARKIVAEMSNDASTACRFIEGNYDHWHIVQATLAALHRGVEIGKGEA